mmetsp:Transcript_21318/g.45364  ORF Transcript_21318/g.45364 Transcript_21318/m.45364 type:complete len:229 (-) Transcript_21318:1559-2245(-)
MVGGLLRDIARELRHLRVALQVSLETSPHDLPLHRLEAIDDARDTAHHVVLCKLHELLLYEVGIGQAGLGMIHEVLIVGSIDPILAVIGTLLVEGEVDKLAILIACVLEGDLVVADVAEVFLRLGRGGGAETLVILDAPALSIVVFLLPLLVLLNCKEVLDMAALGHLHNGGHELEHEPWELEQGGPPMFHQVQDQALNVRAVKVLIGHDHEVTVAETIRRVVDFLRL